MGMFDYVRVEYPMPQGWQDREFQTKGTEAMAMDTYVISQEGRLLYEDYRLEPTDELNFFGLPLLRRADKRLVDTEFHGDLRFYDFEIPNDCHSELVDWQARFTNGQLDWIRREQ